MTVGTTPSVEVPGIGGAFWAGGGVGEGAPTIRGLVAEGRGLIWSPEVCAGVFNAETKRPQMKSNVLDFFIGDAC